METAANGALVYVSEIDRATLILGIIAFDDQFSFE
jgi:hypothetical protein